MTPGADIMSPPTACELQNLLLRLRALDGSDLDEAQMIDRIAVLEKLKGALAAAQARVTVSLVGSRTRREAARGVPAERRCQGLAAEIALARRTSRHRGARHLGLAKALVGEMPSTLEALTTGTVSEWRATLMVRETAVLSRADRGLVDRELGERLTTLGDQATVAEVRKVGYRLDPGSALRRTRGAHADRYVGLRPAPDTMTYLTGFLPVAQGVACKAALQRRADSLRARGDTRSRGQIMADTLVERVTGRSKADQCSVEVELVMTDGSLVGTDDEPAQMVGYGPVPASVARDIVRDADRAWLRRLFTRPGSGSLVAMDARRRVFDGELRRFLVLRDETCRTPWCDAPVRHADHVRRAADGGETSVENGQGLCERCNYAKEAAGWHARLLDGARHQLEITTPTGHTHTSTAPDPPGAGTPCQRLAQMFPAMPGLLDQRLDQLVHA